VENAGHDGGVVAGRLLESNDRHAGFNARTERYEDLVVSGVIDPTMIVPSALQDAAPVTGLC
jgi:chaperonin GroEL